jgi:hypothetical protein
MVAMANSFENAASTVSRRRGDHNNRNQCRRRIVLKLFDFAN